MMIKILANVQMVQMHDFFDMRVVKSTIDYTILFASQLMSNLLHYQASNVHLMEPKLSGACGGKGINYVSPNDVAEVTVHALLAHRDHSCDGYTLTDSQAYTDQLVAQLIGNELKMKVTYIEGLPDDADEDTIAFEKIKASVPKNSSASCQRTWTRSVGIFQKATKISFRTMIQ